MLFVTEEGFGKDACIGCRYIPILLTLKKGETREWLEGVSLKHIAKTAGLYLEPRELPRVEGGGSH